ncbi:uncharacterized protein WM277_012934 isoform 1-T1 [Molossus nigricans]
MEHDHVQMELDTSFCKLSSCQCFLSRAQGKETPAGRRQKGACPSFKDLTSEKEMTLLLPFYQPELLSRPCQVSLKTEMKSLIEGQVQDVQNLPVPMFFGLLKKQIRK